MTAGMIFMLASLHNYPYSAGTGTFASRQSGAQGPSVPFTGRKPLGFPDKSLPKTHFLLAAVENFLFECRRPSPNVLSHRQNL